MMFAIASLVVLLSIGCRCSIVTTNGFITIMDDAYQVNKLNFVKLLGSIPNPLISVKSRDIRFEQQCRLRCVMDPRCQGSSVTYNSSMGLCGWFENSLCDGNTSLAAFGRGEMVVTFEKKRTTDTRSCFEICLERNLGNCTKCFRRGCIGPRCNQCPQTCAQYVQFHQLNSPEITADFQKRLLWLFSSGGLHLQVQCSGYWAVIFSRTWKQNITKINFFVADNYFSYIYNGKTNNILMIEFTRNDDKIYRAVYQNFTINETSLTIRHYLNDSTMYRGNDSLEAGDGFRVPIINAPFMNSSRPECGNFWVLSNRSLSSTTFKSCTSGTYFLGTPKPILSSYNTSTGIEIPMAPTGIAWSTLPGVIFKSVTIKARIP